MKMVIKSIVFRIAVFILRINMNLIMKTTAHSNLKFIFDKTDTVLPAIVVWAVCLFFDIHYFLINFSSLN